MARREAPKWNTIRVRESTYREIERALNCDEMKREGISSITQFATNAITKHLRELELTRMYMVSTYEDHAKIMDDKLGRIGRIVAVYFRKGEDAWCEYCDEADCIHVQYAWELPEVRKVLRGRGLSPPRSRESRGGGGRRTGAGAGRGRAPAAGADGARPLPRPGHADRSLYHDSFSKPSPRARPPRGQAAMPQT